jgi:hypothetical protein
MSEFTQKRRHGVIEDKAAGALQHGAQVRPRAPLVEATPIDLVDQERGLAIV